MKNSCFVKIFDSDSLIFFRDEELLVNNDDANDDDCDDDYIDNDEDVRTLKNPALEELSPGMPHLLSTDTSFDVRNCRFSTVKPLYVVSSERIIQDLVA